MISHRFQSIVMAVSFWVTIWGQSPETVAGEKAAGAGHEILVPVTSGPATHLAAKEIAKYLQQMTADTWVITHDPSAAGKARIELGISNDLGQDGFQLKKDGGRIHILGGSSRGCLYGAYAWLEALGCRWPLPGEEYEIVPRISSIDAFEETRSEPAVRRRGMVYVIYDPGDLSVLERVDFLAKNRFNYLFMHATDLQVELRSRLGRALAEREMGFEFGGHLLPSFLPRDLFDTHPDYFRMDNGKRTANLNMCPSSDEAVDIMAKNIRARYLDPLGKEFSSLETLHFWPDDLFEGGWCACPKCKVYSESDQSLLILNRLSDRLGLDNVMLAHCAYHTSIKPPEKVIGNRGVRLMFAPRERSYLKPMGACHANQWYLECLKGLVKAVPREPEVFEYYHDMILFRCLPMPLHRIIGEDVKVYKAQGIDGIASLSFQAYDRVAYGPNTFILGRALWRGEGASGDISEYCSAVYGSAGSAMERYFDLLFEFCATAMDTCPYDGFVDLRFLPPSQSGLQDHASALKQLVNEEHLNRIEAQLDQALRASNDSHRSRIEQQRYLWRFARVEVPAIYEGLAAKPIIDRALQATSSPEESAEAIARLEKTIGSIDAATQLLYAIPVELRGPFAVKGQGAANEREMSYINSLQAIVNQLKKTE